MGEALFMPQSRTLAYSKLTGNGSSHSKVGSSRKLSSPGNSKNCANNKAQLKDFFPHTYRIIEGTKVNKQGSNSNIQDFQSNSKRLNMVGGLSQQSSTAGGHKKKKKELVASRAASSRAS